MADQKHETTDGAVELGLTAGVAGLFLMLRLLAVSDWNWHTAAAVADSFDFNEVAGIVLGTLFAQPTLSGALLAVVIAPVALRVIWPIGGGRRSATGVLLLLVLVTAVVAHVRTLGTWWVPTIAAVLTAAMFVIRVVRRKGHAQDAVRILMRSAGLITVVGLLVMAAVVDSPWMSKERITTKQGVIEGYVLQAQPGFLKVMTTDRQVLILNSNTVVSRTIED